MRRIFRGKDLGSVGGDLILTDRLLLAVSNRTITAYPRGPGAGAGRTPRCSVSDHTTRGSRMNKPEFAAVVALRLSGARLAQRGAQCFGQPMDVAAGG